MSLNVSSRVSRMFAAFAARGFMSRVVRLAVATQGGTPNQFSGNPGTAPTVAYTTIANALVDMTDQFTSQNGMTLRVGDGAIFCPVGNVVRANILAASWIEIDGAKYTTLAGNLKFETYLTTIVVNRMQS